MPTDAAFVLAVIGALLAAVLLFTASILIGGVLVRVLRLPNELPDELRYEAASPPLTEHPDPAAARAAAAGRAARQAICNQAAACAGLARSLAQGPAAPAAERELERAEAAMREADPDLAGQAVGKTLAALQALAAKS